MSIIGAFIVPHPPIILPEIGRGEERKIRKTIDAYREVGRRVAALKPETVVVTSPHSVMYADYFHISPGKRASGNFSAFRAPEAGEEAEYDTEFVEMLTREAGRENLPAGTFGEKSRELDHGTMIPLRFLHEFCRDFRVVRIGLSGLSASAHYRLGRCIAQTAEKLDRRTVFVASGDLSHKLTETGPYGFAPEGPEFDGQVTQAMRDGDFARFLSFDADFCDAAAECGLRSFQIMAGALDGVAVKPELLSYEGPFGVGYGVATFAVEGKDEARRFLEGYEKRRRGQLDARKAGEDEYVRLAHLSLETCVKNGRRPVLPEGLPEEMKAVRAGAFVSLKKDGRLRGCIGTIEPVTGSVAEEILRNAVSAGTEDPRFDPVEENELDDLVYSVDVLSVPEPVRSAAEFDAKRYGVIVTKGRRRGLLLPDLAGVDTPREQIDIAKQKAGISPREACSLERFEVTRHR